jgi:two-component system NtrC family response regulator
VGGAADIRVDVRVVAATNRNLEEEVAKGRFRSDLYYRLNVLPIALPTLRAHAEDVPLLVEYFIDGFNTEFRKRVLGASPAAYTLLERYGWPGNVRELRNVVERAMLLSEGQRLEAKDFAALTTPAGSAEEFELPAKGVDLEDLERSLVIQALRRSGGNQTKAAALLGLNRDQIRYRIEKFGLTVPQ